MPPYARARRVASPFPATLKYVNLELARMDMARAGEVQTAWSPARPQSDTTPGWANVSEPGPGLPVWGQASHQSRQTQWGPRVKPSAATTLPGPRANAGGASRRRWRGLAPTRPGHAPTPRGSPLRPNRRQTPRSSSWRSTMAYWLQCRPRPCPCPGAKTRPRWATYLAANDCAFFSVNTAKWYKKVEANRGRGTGGTSSRHGPGVRGLPQAR